MRPGGPTDATRYTAGRAPLPYNASEHAAATCECQGESIERRTHSLPGRTPQGAREACGAETSEQTGSLLRLVRHPEIEEEGHFALQANRGLRFRFWVPLGIRLVVSQCAVS